MKIMGIDQSLTGTGCVIVEDSEIIFHKYLPSSPKDGDVYFRVNMLTNKLVKIAIEQEPDGVSIEGISMGSKGHIADLGGLQHVIINHLRYDLNLNIEVIPPTTLKKNAAGKGNATKWMMYDALPDHVRELFEDEYKFSKRESKTMSGSGFDMTDAYHIAANSCWHKIN